jgi:hypothetical protein
MQIQKGNAPTNDRFVGKNFLALKDVGKFFFQTLRGFFIRQNRKSGSGLEAERTKIIHAVSVIGVIMSDNHSVDMINVVVE